MSSIYLTGNSINGADFSQINLEPDWRAHAMSTLQRYGLRVVNPIAWAWEGNEEQEGVERRVRRALDLIDQCDALLANLNPPSYGAAMEMFYAHRRGKMVTVVGQSPFSPWILSHSKARFTDIDPALEYLIEEHAQADYLASSLQYESLLSERYEQLPPAGEPDYQFMGGELPILVLAPHATAYFREGEFQEADAFTGSLAASLNRLTNCHSLISSYCLVADPCWHTETPMVRAIAEIIKSGQIGLVLICLGSSWHESHSLLVNHTLPLDSGYEEIINHLRLKLQPADPLVACTQDAEIKPLLELLSGSLKVPVITLKIHRRYRMPRLHPELFSQLVNMLGEFISDQGAEFLRTVS